MDANGFVDFIGGLLSAFMNFGTWLQEPLFQLGDLTFTPLALFTLTGLTVLIAVAFGKWVIS